MEGWEGGLGGWREGESQGGRNRRMEKRDGGTEIKYGRMEGVSELRKLFAVPDNGRMERRNGEEAGREEGAKIRKGATEERRETRREGQKHL